jgi:pyruvate dehydrogenase E1 component alpha subunit
MTTTMGEKERKLALEVLRVRYWQHVINEGLKKNAFPVPVHTAFGHEAVAVAVSHVMQQPDQLALSHRNMAYNLARAGVLRPVWDEYKNRPTGLGHGKSGSMNLSNAERGVVYTSSILGNNVSVACGLAMGMKMKGTVGFVTVVTGDGAMEEGPFYESLVFAKSHQLPVLFLVENNNFSMSSTIPERRCPIAIDHLCQSVDMPYISVRGNNVFDYAESFADCRERVTRKPGPVVVEAFVTNHYRHAGPTPGFPGDPMNIDIKNGLTVKASDEDPVFVLRANMHPAEYEQLENEVLAERWSD